MKDKIQSEITALQLNSATFHNVSVTPTLINFFYGKNGVGKSTIAREIYANNGVTWADGKSKNDFSVLVYNDDFIKRNFETLDSLNGVFSIGEEDINIRNQIEEKTAERNQLREDFTAKNNEKSTKEKDKDALTQSFNRAAFDSALAFRSDFKDALAGKLRTDGFISELIKQTNPVNHDLEELKNLYNTAFSKDSRDYQEFKPIDPASLVSSLLVDKSIVSSSNSTFADFVKKIQASDWVRHGHETFKNTNDKCPYCQQSLPVDFEENITSIFDEQYQKDIDGLKQFQSEYQNCVKSMSNILDTNLRDVYPKLNLTEYNDKFNIFKVKATKNISDIALKLKTPASPVKIEDLTSLINEINSIIDELNVQIKTNNDILATKQAKKVECTRKIWELIYSKLKPQIDAYQTSLAKLGTEIQTLNNELSLIKDEGKALSAIITQLKQKFTK